MKASRAAFLNFLHLLRLFVATVFLMAIELNKQEIAEIVPSLQKYFREELEMDLSEMHAKFFLNYIMKEIAPVAYNKGVEDAERYFRARTEELAGSCFEPPLTFWPEKAGRKKNR